MGWGCPWCRCGVSGVADILGGVRPDLHEPDWSRAGAGTTRELRSAVCCPARAWPALRNSSIRSNAAAAQAVSPWPPAASGQQAGPTAPSLVNGKHRQVRGSFRQVHEPPHAPRTSCPERRRPEREQESAEAEPEASPHSCWSLPAAPSVDDAAGGSPFGSPGFRTFGWERNFFCGEYCHPSPVPESSLSEEPTIVRDLERRRAWVIRAAGQIHARLYGGSAYDSTCATRFVPVRFARAHPGSSRSCGYATPRGDPPAEPRGSTPCLYRTPVAARVFPALAGEWPTCRDGAAQAR